jgi:hypothetical protein
MNFFSQALVAKRRRMDTNCVGNAYKRGYPVFSPLKRSTENDENAVNIPRKKIPTLKLKWSAVHPKRNGIRPIPNPTPTDIITPNIIDRVEREASFETVARATGKKPSERKACRTRKIKMMLRWVEMERPIVLNPVKRRLRKRMVRYPYRSTKKPIRMGTAIPPALEIPNRVLASSNPTPLSLIR